MIGYLANVGVSVDAFFGIDCRVVATCWLPAGEVLIVGNHRRFALSKECYPPWIARPGKQIFTIRDINSLRIYADSDRLKDHGGNPPEKQGDYHREYAVN